MHLFPITHHVPMPLLKAGVLSFSSLDDCATHIPQTRPQTLSMSCLPWLCEDYPPRAAGECGRSVCGRSVWSCGFEYKCERPISLPRTHLWIPGTPGSSPPVDIYSTFGVFVNKELFKCDLQSAPESIPFTITRTPSSSSDLRFSLGDAPSGPAARPVGSTPPPPATAGWAPCWPQSGPAPSFHGPVVDPPGRVLVFGTSVVRMRHGKSTDQGFEPSLLDWLQL